MFSLSKRFVLFSAKKSGRKQIKNTDPEEVKQEAADQFVGALQDVSSTVPKLASPAPALSHRDQSKMVLQDLNKSLRDALNVGPLQKYITGGTGGYDALLKDKQHLMDVIRRIINGVITAMESMASGQASGMNQPKALAQSACLDVLSKGYVLGLWDFDFEKALGLALVMAVKRGTNTTLETERQNSENELAKQGTPPKNRP